jgi:hypothetical protein
MSRTQLLLLATASLAIASPPVEAVGQVNLPTFRNLATGEVIERPYENRYRQSVLDRQRRVQLRRSEKLMEFPDDRTAAYAADACGLGCEGHEGLQVLGIPGTRLAAVVYKALLDDHILTVQLRFHNDGLEPARLAIDPETPGSVFVQVGEERLSILVDEDGTQQSKGALDEVLDPGEIESWWARFPAPSSDATSFDLHVPAGIFRDVPLAND